MTDLPPVLCYHRVGGPLELGVTRVARRIFERQMRTLAATGWRTLTLAEYERRQAGWGRERRAARREFLLTFDDGYASLAETAYPVLADLGFTATTFLITDYVGQSNTWDARFTWRRLAHLDWATVERWRARGFEFGSHGATHRRLTWLDDAVVGGELERSRRALHERLGATTAAAAIAYPFGAADARVTRLAGQAGYRLGFGGVRGTASEPLDQPRVPVYLWDVWTPPAVLRSDPLGRLARGAAHIANRSAVGTSVMLRLVRRESDANRVRCRGVRGDLHAGRVNGSTALLRAEEDPCR